MDILRFILPSIHEDPHKHRRSFMYLEPEPEDILMELLANTPARLLVLDTRDLVEAYERRFIDLQGRSRTLDQVLDIVVRLLQRKAEVQMGLDYELIDIAEELIGREDNEDHELVSGKCFYATRDFGYALYERFLEQQIYRNGFLPYQYVGCSFGDIILALPEVDGISTPKVLR